MRFRSSLAFAAVLVLTIASAGAEEAKSVDAKAPAKTESKPAAPAAVESKDILAREVTTESAEVLHVLVSWKDLAPTYEKRGGQDPRGAARSKAEADKLALEIAKQAGGGADFKKLMAEHSEDPGSAKTGNAYPVTASAGLVPPFKNLSLRLKLDEAGIVETVFGWHVIKRIK